jgi:hypothetical protein
MYLMGIAFLVTVSRNVRFITANALQDRKKNTIWKALNQVMNIYKSRGHLVEEVEFSERENEIHTILVENEFEALKERFKDYGVKVNIMEKEELLTICLGQELSIRVSRQRASLFHSTVAKLLFVAKRAWPDILLVVSFLTTRVKDPDE